MTEGTGDGPPSVILILSMTAEIKGITKKYGKNPILHDVSFMAKEGEEVCIVGKNGSGKTTLLSVLAGIREAGEGAFFLDGIDLFKDTKALVEHVSYVPQDPPLIPELSAKDNLLLRYSKEDMMKSLENGFLKELGIDEFLKTRVHNMSLGMKKRLSIGYALSGDPKILILDEPGASLDLSAKKIVRDFVKNFKAKGGIVIVASHEPDEIRDSDRHFLLKNGKLQQITVGDDLNGLFDEFGIY